MPLSSQVDTKYGGDHRRVVNLVRASGVFDNLVDISQALDALHREQGELRIVRVKGALQVPCCPARTRASHQIINPTQIA